MSKIDIEFFHEIDLQKSLLLKGEDGTTLLESKLLPEALENSGKISKLTVKEEHRLESNAGRPDILAFHITTVGNKKFYDLHILELKKDEVKLSALSQVLRYRNYTEQYFKSCITYRDLIKKGILRIHCHLIGKSLQWSSGDSFYTMLHCQEKMSILNHEYTFNPTKGLCFETYKNCTNYKIKGEDESFGFIEDIIHQDLQPKLN